MHADVCMRMHGRLNCCASAAPTRLLPVLVTLRTLCGARMHVQVLTSALLAPMQCPMIARKFPKESAQALVRVLSDCRNQLNILVGPQCDADYEGT